MPVEHLDAARHARGDVLVVGDHHDRGAGRMQLLEQREDGLPGGLVEVAGGLVGQDDRRLPDQGAGDRHPLPLADRDLGRVALAAGQRGRPRPAPRRRVSRRCLIGTPA